MRPLFVLLPLFGITIASPAANSETPSWELYTGATNDDYMDKEKHRIWNNRVRIEVGRYIESPEWDCCKLKTGEVNTMKQHKLYKCVEVNEENKRNWFPAKGPAKYANWDVNWKRACSQWL